MALGELETNYCHCVTIKLRIKYFLQKYVIISTYSHTCNKYIFFLVCRKIFVYLNRNCLYLMIDAVLDSNGIVQMCIVCTNNAFVRTTSSVGERGNLV